MKQNSPVNSWLRVSLNYALKSNSLVLVDWSEWFGNFDKYWTSLKCAKNV